MCWNGHIFLFCYVELVPKFVHTFVLLIASLNILQISRRDILNNKSELFGRKQ
jgi:hypothetical protein